MPLVFEAMPRKLRAHRTPTKPALQTYINEDQSRFVFTVDPQCIITFPIDHCLYVCDICSSVLKTQDLFKKHYIKLHINHAYASLSDLKFCEAFPINLSKFKEDEGRFRCHFCIALFFSNKSDLKLHLNQHGPLQEIPEEPCLVLNNEMEVQKENSMEGNETGTIKITPYHYSDEDLSACLEAEKISIIPVVTSVLTELLPAPKPNLATHSEVLVTSPQPLVTETLNFNVDEAITEPLSGLLGSSLLTLFNTSFNVVPDSLSTLYETSLLPKVERCSSPLFAQDCSLSYKSFSEHYSTCNLVAASSESTTEALPVQSSYYALTSLPESSSLPPRENLSSSISSSSGFSSASTEDLVHLEDNDVIDRSEESFSSLASSNSEEESSPAECKNTFDINMDNIVLSCLFCDKIFASIKSTRTHMLKSHHSKVHWECVFCKTNFKNCDFLLNHLCSNHADIYFACISCKIRFDSKAAMDSHFQNKHNSENTTKIFNKITELKNKDDILQQLKCIPYYTNQNFSSNLLSRKIKLNVFDKLSFPAKPPNQKQVTNQSVQVSEEDISHECQKKIHTPLSFNGSILKRKLMEPTTLPQSKIIKMSKNFNQIAMESNSFESKLPILLPSAPTIVESEQKIVADKNLAVVDEFLSDVDNAEKYLASTAIKLELDPNYTLKNILCLFCNKMTFSLKGKNTHISKVHKIRRGGKYCCFCNTNFRTLDLLFRHLCSSHGHVYFACVFCKERFDSNTSLLLHFDTVHDSVNVNKKSVSEDQSTRLEDLKKEIFMYQLKCLPSDPSKLASCSPDCKMCSSAGKEDLEVPKTTDYTPLCELEAKESENKIIEHEQTIQMSLVKTHSVEESQNHFDVQNAMKHESTKSAQQEVTKQEIQSNVLDAVMNSSLDKSLVESTEKDSGKITESYLKFPNVENLNSSVTSVSSADLPLKMTKPPVTIGMYEDLSIELVCLFCDRTFDKAKAFRVHLFRSHKAKKNKCMYCTTVFSFYEDLFAHLTAIHSDVYFACNVCKLRHTTKELLGEHMVNFHTLVATQAITISEKTLEDNASDNRVTDVPISTEKVQDTAMPNCVPEIITTDVINDVPCSKLTTSFTEVIDAQPSATPIENSDARTCPSAALGLQPIRKNAIQVPNESNDTPNLDYFISTSSIDSSNKRHTNNVTTNIDRSSKDYSNKVESSIDASSTDLSTISPLGIDRVSKDQSNIDASSKHHSSIATSCKDHTNKVTSSKDHSSIDTSNKDHSSIEISSKIPLNRVTSSIDTSSNGRYSPCRLINYTHPTYENIAMKNFSHMDITVQLQVLSRVKAFNNELKHTPLYPLKPPQRQPRTSGKFEKKKKKTQRCLLWKFSTIQNIYIYISLTREIRAFAH